MKRRRRRCYGKIEAGSAKYWGTLGAVIGVSVGIIIWSILH